jgi:hypothetical protein
MAEERTFYVANPWLLARHGILTCSHCHMLPDGHHPDQRCYTATELIARLSFWQRTGLWPKQGEVPEDGTCG